MKKLVAILFSILLSQVLLAQATSTKMVKGIEKGKHLGAQFMNENGEVAITIEPIYEDVMVFISQRIGNLNLGEFYLSARYFHDTEFVEVPIDPNDYTLTKIDTIVQDYKYYVAGKPILVKQQGKWGVLHPTGNVLLPSEYTDFTEYAAAHWQNFGSDRLPLLLLSKNNAHTLIDALGNIVVKPAQFPAYFNTIKRKTEALEMSFFGDYLLINEGGVIGDSLVKVPAKKEIKNGKVVFTEKAYTFNFYIYKYGRFNAIDLRTGEKLLPEPKTNMEIKFKDPDGKELFDSLNPRNYNSLQKYSENKGLGIVPAMVEFIGKD